MRTRKTEAEEPRGSSGEGESAGLALRMRGEVVLAPLSRVRRNWWNFNEMTPRETESLREGLRAEGWLASFALLVWGTDEAGARRDVIIDGEHRHEEATKLGFVEGPMVFLDGLTEAEARAWTVKLAERRGHSNDDRLGLLLRGLPEDLLDAVSLGLDDERLAKLTSLEPGGGGGAGGGAGASAAPSMADRFGCAPFSVLNARAGDWQERKSAWLALGIESEVGRGDNLLGMSETVTSGKWGKKKPQGQTASLKGGLTVGTTIHPYDCQSPKGAASISGTSIFDPVLCELVYRWFSAPGGEVFDPFAGGSVRGIIASKLGRRYSGVDLRGDQVGANRIQARDICKGDDPLPVWIEGDSKHAATIAPGEVDLVFSCPPYASLERYSDDPRDLSTMDYPSFREVYREIIAAACAKLRRDRFACFVVGEVRDKKGLYLGLVPDTIAAFEAAGLRFYNEAILITMVSSLPIRAGRAFESARKLGKTHQNVLVFVKGDPRRAALACGPASGVALDLTASESGEEGEG